MSFPVVVALKKMGEPSVFMIEVEEAKRDEYELLRLWLKEEDGANLADLLRMLSFRNCGPAIDFLNDHLDKMDLSAYVGDGSCRKAVEGDVDGIKRIAYSAFKKSYFYTSGLFDQRRVDEYHARWAENMFRDTSGTVLIAEGDGAVAGFTAFVKNGDEARIILIAVAGPFLRKGIGSRLMAAALAWGRDNGIRRFRVKTQSANAGAIALYRKHGFTPAARGIIYMRQL